MDDWHLEEQMQDYENERRKCILWEAANQIVENKISEEEAIGVAESLEDERDEAIHNEEIIDNGSTFSYLNPELEGVTASNRRQTIAIYHRLCEKESIDPYPYPFT